MSFYELFKYYIAVIIILPTIFQSWENIRL